MKLLLDQNLSPRLVERLQDLYPGSTHVTDVALDRASDDEVWNFAKTDDFMIVSKDSDFGERVLLRGAPPKVLWKSVMDQKRQLQYEANRRALAQCALDDRISAIQCR